ncbi:MAG: PAS domain S-box protein, partial [Holophaga sp.]|nr:PAS domain S-box protein [Holophaga sp.]
KWHTSSAVPTRNELGLVTGLEGTARDITERMAAEEALREKNAELERYFSSSLDLLCIADTGGHFLRLNPEWEKVLGYSLQDLEGRSFLELVHPEDMEGTLAAMSRLDAQEQVTSFENRYRCKDGSYRWIEWRSRPQGNLIYAAATDITERKQAKQALHESEQKFRTLFENLTEGVALHELVTDAAGKVVDYRLLAVNPAYETHTGLAAATAPGLLGTEIYGTVEPPYLAEFSQVALGGEPYAFETFFPPLEKHFRISVISPKKGQFATVFEDITERKHREEELKQKNAEMERFTYMISHDLKSPLVTVRTFLGYLEQDLEQGRAERVAKDMDFIRNATGKMGRLLDDLLEVSRVGRVVNPPVRVDLADLIAEALAAVAGAISTRGVEIKVEVPAITLFGDRPRLEEIWQNLVENAVKYMGEQPAPRIELGAEGAGVDTVFFVRDNGLGIDPKFQDKVFGLFEQLDAASEGTGLGLALVKRIVELNEGRIWLESEGAGHGTCFRFTLPLALKGRAKEAR